MQWNQHHDSTMRVVPLWTTQVHLAPESHHRIGAHQIVNITIGDTLPILIRKQLLTPESTPSDQSIAKLDRSLYTMMHNTCNYTLSKTINTTYMIMLNYDSPLYNLYTHDNHNIHQYFTTSIHHRITSFMHNIICTTMTHT